ncbi:ABC transporter substrate-binding protein [Reichenbachiella carrageenanivorans]|uniref:ABC transporter substrate-binding protein n=1 Tax=Reichenbachiella carrageenanivorans TaxID=2979869 RepID=A0ABY6CW01_9BACT|nr:ABC transporter substrate-binding protein [Reichenbachiella carrageenanivorans]UXX78089.1 ABC transporter substrate-binding protein [Reichenbachiella carrageenanivorans]
MNKHLSFFLCLAFFSACTSSSKTETTVASGQISEIKQAERFQISYAHGVKVITIDKPWQGSKKPIQYVLYKDSVPSVFQSDDSYIKIKTPVKSIVSNLTTQLALMEDLGVADRLIGFAQTQFIYSPSILEKVKSGEVKEVGPDGSLDIESILNLNPDIVLAFNASAENRQLQKLEELGLKIVMNAGYMETSLLGRFEWIKLLGHLTGTESLANDIFDKKALIYDSLVQLVKGMPQPTVITGTLYGGTWFMPAGDNYGANIVTAAGGDYLWKEDKNAGWLSMDFESVYERGYNADYWIGVASYTSLDQLKAADERYAEFEAFKNGRVYSYMARVNEQGANDYFESGNVNPEKLLADHIKIMHPELLPDYELYYYMKLE